MIKNRTILKSVLGWIGTLAIVSICPLSYAQKPVIVKALAVHYGGTIQYSYQVSNQTRARSIVSVSIGNRGEQTPDPVNPGNDQPELNIYPVGSYWQRMPDQGDSQNVTLRVGGTYASPPGWSADILGYEESSYFSVDWDRQVQIDPGILPGQTLNFGVTIPTNYDPRSDYTMNDPAYLTGHFTVGFDYSSNTNEGPASWNYTGIIVPIDTTPPTLSITLTPSKIWPPNEKMVTIAATINVWDDHDPSPEIKLESITANEVLDSNDVKDAKFFTDDRQFQLKAEREGKNKTGRIYTVSFSATDASGNQAIATATVTVPHDERVHEDRRDKDGKKEKDSR
ncbi:MAG: hypothetical protein ACOH1I_11490 [Gallionellaceae bacterium]|jgi:hypothetical protein